MRILPTVEPVDFGSLRRLSPISSQWGFDRGQPVDRHYIEGFLERHASDVRGGVLEVESNHYTMRFGEDRVTKSDVLHLSADHPGVTIAADLTDAPNIPSALFDCIILTQTLQYIFELRAAIATLHRILRPGGVLLITVPGLSRTSDHLWSNSWYWNFTSRTLRRLFADSSQWQPVVVQGYGNVLAATAFLQGLSAHELTREELESYDEGYELCVSARVVRPC